ncbi:hypothetical protein K449DRAFT_436094 [Hypoxylon sp. EC38]|nr:hypothetical protein K449DRAFT_436094 [Hypoxylon sp. EC38]
MFARSSACARADITPRSFPMLSAMGAYLVAAEEREAEYKDPPSGTVPQKLAP